jgi:hypothetical protein
MTVAGRIAGQPAQADGPDQPDILATRYELANRLGRAGDAPGAVRAFKELLDDMERVHGYLHPETRATRRNLIALLRSRAEFQ